MLTISSYAPIAEAIVGETFETKREVSGAVADLLMTAYFAFLANCSEVPNLRCALIRRIANRKIYITTLTKIFNVASPRTRPHVLFQKEVIVSYSSRLQPEC